jgi:transcription initiation factor TFIIIB Brf1 subunit/transcription initiation factor TFIIB
MSKYPIKWKEDLSRQVYLLCLLGATDREVAEVLGVEPVTIDFWKRTKPEFSEAMERGKIQTDAKVAESLLKCALGYEYEEEVVHVVKGEVVITTVKKYKGPDAWAANKWLSLRQREKWSESHNISITDNRTVNINNFNMDDMSSEELMLMKSIISKQLPQADAGD